jgi:hypothetical protein
MLRPISLPTRGALLALAILGGGVVLAFPASGGVTAVAVRAGLPLGPAIFLSVLLLCGGAAGALWAWRLAPMVGDASRRGRAAAGGALGFGTASALAVHGLTTIETRLLAHAQAGEAAPMHVAFALSFSGAAVLVVGASVLALGLGLGLRRRALGPALRTAGVGGGTFLAVTLLLDLAGWRVGAPGAEARFTMLVVMAAALVVTLLAAGATAASQLRAAAR